MSASKFVRESLTTMTEMVMPNDTNPLGNLMGGNLLKLMDIAGAIAAQKHSNSLVVTASMDNVSFVNAIHLGNVVTIEAKVTRAFSTSMEVMIQVFTENIPAGTKKMTNQAFLTFVAVNDQGTPILVREAVPETAEEKEFYEGALRRRQLRLVLAKRMKPEDATELKSIFVSKKEG
ncbi:MAG: acyl-CoA thioesterase [Leadbetterella sp.]